MPADPPTTATTALIDISRVRKHLLSCTLYDIILRLIIGGSILTLGMIGNGLTILVMSQEKRKTSTILALLYLAISDFFVVLFYGALTVNTPLAELFGSDILPYQMKMFGHKYLMLIGQIFNLVSTLTTVIVIWQRYIGICWPHKARSFVSSKHVHIQVLSATIFAVAFISPQFASMDIVDKREIIFKPFALHLAYQGFYQGVLQYSISYIVPAVSLAVMTFGLSKTLRKNKIVSDSQSQAQRAKRELTLSLVVIVCVFTVCQSWPLARRILQIFYPDYGKLILCGGKFFFFGPIELIMIVLNSSANFFVFIICARGFRKKVLHSCYLKCNRVQALALSGNLSSDFNGTN